MGRKKKLIIEVGMLVYDDGNLGFYCSWENEPKLSVDDSGTLVEGGKCVYKSMCLAGVWQRIAVIEEFGNRDVRLEFTCDKLRDCYVVLNQVDYDSLGLLLDFDKASKG